MDSGRNQAGIYANGIGVMSIVIPVGIYLFGAHEGCGHGFKFVAAVSSSSFSLFMLSYWIRRNWCVNLPSGDSKQYLIYCTLIGLCTVGLVACLGETFLYGLCGSYVDVLKTFATFSSISYIRFRCLGLLPRPVYRCSNLGNAVSIISIIAITCAIGVYGKNSADVVAWSFVVSGAVLAAVSLGEEMRLPKERDVWDISKSQPRGRDFVQLALFSLGYYWPGRLRA